jgi:O-antigen/teichoic acid export membrane protein
MRRIWRRATYALALVLIPIFAALEVFADDIIALVFGEDYRAAAAVFRVNCLVLPISVLLGSAMLRTTGDLRAMFWAVSGSLGITILALLSLLVVISPMVAAAFSMVAGQLAYNVVATIQGIRRLQVGIGGYAEWKKIAAVSLVSFASAALAEMAVPATPVWWRALAGPALTIAVFGLLAWWWRLIPEQERKLAIDTLLALRRRVRRATDRGPPA